MELSIRMIACQVILVMLCLIKPAASLSCYQQPYTPGQTSLYSSTNNLPKMTCSGSATSCFKMACYGTTYYTIRGCYDYTQPLYNCQTLATQCPGATGQCFTCNGNNCNGTWSAGSSIKTVLILLGIPALLYYVLMKN